MYNYIQVIWYDRIDFIPALASNFFAIVMPLLLSSILSFSSYSHICLSLFKPSLPFSPLHPVWMVVDSVVLFKTKNRNDMNNDCAIVAVRYEQWGRCGNFCYCPCLIRGLNVTLSSENFILIFVNKVDN